MTLTESTINHPTNSLYSSTYIIGLCNTQTGEEVFLASTRKPTVQRLWSATCDNGQAIVDITGGANATKKGKGPASYLAIEGTDWIVKRLGTLREYHGRTIKRIAG